MLVAARSFRGLACCWRFVDEAPRVIDNELNFGAGSNSPRAYPIDLRGRSGAITAYITHLDVATAGFIAAVAGVAWSR